MEKESKNKKTVSVVMICKNEEAMMERAINSVIDADELIICDTGSIDRTVEIAKKYTKNVCTSFKWCDDFAAARNHAKAHATSDYILSLDMDEYVHDFSKVREAIEWDCDALNVKMVMENVEPESHFYFPRLFKNVPHVFWVGAIHNCLNIGPDRDSEVAISYGNSPAHLLDPDRALRVLEKEVKRNPENAREWYYLGREYWYKQNYPKCTETLGHYVQIAHWDREKADAFLIMARAYSTQGMDEDARDACLQAIKINPHFKEALLFMAAIVPDKHASQWKRMAETADNTEILFLRV
jgi:glycosyltransferase involved in cell wall biosynthesis